MPGSSPVTSTWERGFRELVSPAQGHTENKQLGRDLTSGLQAANPELSPWPHQVPCNPPPGQSWAGPLERSGTSPQPADSEPGGRGCARTAGRAESPGQREQSRPTTWQLSRCGPSHRPSPSPGGPEPLPFPGTPEEQAGDSLLHVHAPKDGGGDALGNDLVDIGEGGQAPKLLLLRWGHSPGEAAAWVGRGGVHESCVRGTSSSPRPRPGPSLLGASQKGGPSESRQRERQHEDRAPVLPSGVGLRGPGSSE